ncbi:CDP-alcohol phosphatidyltransferase family protein [Rhodospirillaceae bacterium KN72]|uniref:CDP-alcohol phosphatidyltransferase family protein n=1 Tax=Pacificispira spongiicola TaxID=2729598 RepID=A0A7Y0HEE9_9PROT|nr:CDP-alcohol phosphatidyltransferase family protein [Pacificispira spongiicola]NMM42877.1 CDP-alcohol phosphatidyltransferase family protein [Pacificispira spongiicola]
MFDARLRPLIDPPLAWMARGLVRYRINANQVTLLGAVPGFAAAVCIGFELYLTGLVLILLNRLSDGLDGAVARQTRATDFGGYLDIVLDFLFYAVIPLGFAVAHPEVNALPAAVLIASFIGTGSSFLAYAIVAAKRGISTEIRGKKSFYHLGGLTEGTETIAFLVLCCLLPNHFPVLAYGFAALCCVTTATRIAAAYQTFTNGEAS